MVQFLSASGTSFLVVVTKGQLISKCFLLSSILPKTEQKIWLYYYGTSSRIVFVRFLGELKTSKIHSEINWLKAIYYRPYCIVFLVNLKLIILTVQSRKSRWSWYRPPAHYLVYEREAWLYMKRLQCNLIWALSKAIFFKVWEREKSRLIAKW